MLQLDKKLVSELEEKWIEKVKVFFYESGCSGTKIDIAVADFETQGLLKTDSEYGFDIYVESDEKAKFENCSITRVQKADHTGELKSRYIYSSEEVLDRCGCGTSFAFEKKKPKIDLEKLKNLKHNFWK